MNNKSLVLLKEVIFFQQEHKILNNTLVLLKENGHYSPGNFKKNQH